MHLGRPVVHPEGPDLPGDAGDGQVCGNAQAATELRGPVHDPADGLRAERLGDGRLLGGQRAAVERSAGDVKQGAGRGEVDLVLGDQMLRKPMVAERPTEDAARRHVVQCGLVGSDGGPEPPHDVRHPRGPQPDLDVAEALIDLTQHRGQYSALVGVGHIRGHDEGPAARGLDGGRGGG